MELKEFFDRYDDKYLEMGGSQNAINQCTDEANGEIVYVLGHDAILGANADDFPSRCMDFMDWYPYQGQYPEEGDLVVWDMGSYGHIASATGVMNGSKFQTFSQNYPLKSPCHYVDFPLTNNIIGYLRKKATVSDPYSDPVWVKAHETNVQNQCYRAILLRDGSQAEIAGWARVNPDINKVVEAFKGAAQPELTARLKACEAKKCPPKDCTAETNEVKAEMIKALNNQKVEFEKETTAIMKEHQSFAEQSKIEVEIRDDKIEKLQDQLEDVDTKIADAVVKAIKPLQAKVDAGIAYYTKWELFLMSLGFR